MPCARALALNHALLTRSYIILTARRFWAKFSVRLYWLLAAESKVRFRDDDFIKTPSPPTLIRLSALYIAVAPVLSCLASFNALRRRSHPSRKMWPKRFDAPPPSSAHRSFSKSHKASKSSSSFSKDAGISKRRQETRHRDSRRPSTATTNEDSPRDAR
jgi:hypothetical protein